MPRFGIDKVLIAILALAAFGGLLSWLRRPVLWDVFGPLYALAFALFPFGGTAGR